MSIASTIAVCIGFFVHAEPRPAANRLAPAILHSFDIEEGTLIATVRGDGGRQRETFNLNNKDLQITSDAPIQAKLKDLAPDSSVMLRISPVGDVVGIFVPAPTQFLRVFDVDVENRTVSFGGRFRGIRESLKVAKDAVILVDGRTRELRDVPLGASGVARMSWQSNEIFFLALRFDLRRLPDIDEEPNVAGVLEAIDFRTGTVKVQISKDGKSEIKSFESYPNATMSVIDGRGNLLPDLCVGMKVELWLDPPRERIVRLKGEAAIAGVVKDVDVAKKTITLAGDKDSPDKVWTIAADARLLVHGFPCELQDFFPGWNVRLALTPDGKEALKVWTLSAPR